MNPYNFALLVVFVLAVVAFAVIGWCEDNEPPPLVERLEPQQRSVRLLHPPYDWETQGD